ncbi:hypothetical protein MASR2M15_16550 [Anaerolineales bacterium]
MIKIGKLWIVGWVWLGVVMLIQGQVATPQLMVETSLSQQQAYVGESVRYSIRIQQSEELENTQIKFPQFIGFKRILGEERNTILIEGDQQNTLFEQDLILNPIREGRFQIEGLEVSSQTPSGEIVRQVTAVQQLTILPWPQPIPEDFQGAIGQFELQEASFEVPLVEGQPILFTIKVTGTGNIDQLETLQLNLPEGWQALALKSKYEAIGDQFGIKTLSWYLIPAGNGVFLLPEQSMSYLDPETGLYHESRIPEQLIEVVRADNPLSKPVEALRPIVYTGSPALKVFPVWIFIVLAVPVIILMVYLLGSRKKSAPSIAKKKRGKTVYSAHKDIEAIKGLQKRPQKEACEMSEFIIIQALNQKLKRSDIRKDNWRDETQALPERLRVSLSKFFELSGDLPYAASSKSDLHQMLRQAIDLLYTIEETSL